MKFNKLEQTLHQKIENFNCFTLLSKNWQKSVSVKSLKVMFGVFTGTLKNSNDKIKNKIIN